MLSIDRPGKTLTVGLVVLFLTIREPGRHGFKCQFWMVVDDSSFFQIAFVPEG